MTRVDFYVLENASASDHDQMICRVVEKAFQRGHEVYVRCGDESAAQAFDDLLWRFQDTSFVPHGREDTEAPVVIGCGEAAPATLDVLVNLAPAVPAEVSSYARVIESAGFDETTRASARIRYRHYQDRGFPLNTHKIPR